MKFTIFLCALLVTALTAQNVVFSLKARIRAADESCNKDPATRIEDVVQREDPFNHGVHAFCISKAIGWQNADGSINVEPIRSRATALFGENAKIDEIITECAQVQITPEATAKYLFACYGKHL